MTSFSQYKNQNYIQLRVTISNTKSLVQIEASLHINQINERNNDLLSSSI